MEWIPNQPLFFYDTEAIDCDTDESEFVQIIDNTDDSQFQLSVEPCISAQQFLPNPQFATSTGWDLQSNWSFGVNTLCATNSGSLIETTTIIPEGYWKITLNVASITGSIVVNLDGNDLATITSTGQFDVYGFVGISGANLTLVPFGLVSVCFTTIEMYPILTNLIVPIYDQEGVYQTNISYNNEPDFFVFSDDTVTVTIDWSNLGISNGCYYLCLLDPCQNTNGQNYPATIINSGFTGSRDGWEGGGLWVYGTNDIVGTYAGVDNSNDINQPTVFNSFNTTFCIDINVTSISGEFAVYFGENLVQSITTPGVHRVCGIPSANFILRIVMVSGTATLNSVSPVIIQPEDYVCNASSKLLKIGDYSNNCTLLINACNNENGLGFNFNGSGFSPRLRLPAKLKNAKYLNERSVYEDSRGKKSSYYFSGRKQKTLAIDLIPEYLHDFLALSLGFDNFYVNGIPYFVDDDEYQVIYPENFDNIGGVLINISEKTQNIKNTFCSDSENVCTLPPNYLLRVGKTNEYIVQTDGSKILISA